MENVNVNVNEEEVRTEEVTVRPKAKAKAKPVRTIEVLENLGVKSMTDQEMRKYIEHLRTELADVQGRLQVTNEQASKAFERCRLAETELGRIKDQANTKIKFLYETMQHAAKTAEMALKGER